jgi:hypothetical protein
LPDRTGSSPYTGAVRFQSDSRVLEKIEGRENGRHRGHWDPKEQYATVNAFPADYDNEVHYE